MSGEHGHLRTQQCRCDEYPQAVCDRATGEVHFECRGCGRVGRPGADIQRGIANWNEDNTEGAPQC